MEQKLSFTTEQLEEIKRENFNLGIASNQGHNQASKQTVEMFSNLRDDLKDSLGEIRRKIDEHAENNKENFKSVTDRLDYTNGKVRSLQIFRASIVGGMSVIVILIVPVLIYIIQNYISDNSQYKKLSDTVSSLAQQISDSKLINK